MTPRTSLSALAAATVAALGCTSALVPQPPSARNRTCSPDLKPFLESYFATWSAGDMDSYRSHFHPFAVITLVDRGEVVLSIPRDEFVALQAKAIARARMVERMTSFAADEDDCAASVTAKWLLEKEGTKKTGVDRFTLIRDREGSWRIVALLFYGNWWSASRPTRAKQHSCANPAILPVTLRGQDGPYYREPVRRAPRSEIDTVMVVSPPVERR